jgi:hypothetical protein
MKTSKINQEDYIKLKKLSTSAFRHDGTLRSFSEQLYLWRKEKLNRGDLIIISAHTTISLIPEIKDLPLVIKQSTVKKIVDVKHKIAAKYFSELDRLIQQSPLAIESRKRKGVFLVVLGNQNENNKELIIIMEINREKSGIFVNEIESIYPKNIQKMLNVAHSSGKQIFINGMKGESWLNQKNIDFKNNLFK